MRISIPFKKQVNKQKVKEVSGYVLKNPKFGQKKTQKQNKTTHRIKCCHAHVMQETDAELLGLH